MSTAARYTQSMLPGTSQAEIAANTASKKEAPAPELETFQSTLAVQEYIQALIRHDPSDIPRIITNPPQHDQSVWLYESLRQVMVDLNEFVLVLGSECTALSCPKMCATENWIFLCAAHGGKQPKECCAIDYILHTLTNFTVLLTAPDAFPNRYTISAKSAQQFGNIARRLYRVFAHAFYHHRALFDQMETRTHLTKRFIQLSLKYDLMTQAQLTPPMEL